MQHQQHQSTWILVSDAARARLFQEDPKHRRLVPIDHMTHDESRAHLRDILADAQGQWPLGAAPARPSGAHGRPGAGPETDEKAVEAQKFARELAARLEKGLNDHAYERLILVAPPHFLGLLRDTVSAQVQKHVTASIDKDLTSEDLESLTSRLGDVLSTN